MTRIISKFGIAAALTLGMVATAAAQTGKTTPPTKKVPITKEAPGEVVPIHDTVTVYVHDTTVVTRYRRDTLTVTGATITRHDTTTLIQAPGWMNRGSGLYFGVGAGTSYGNGGLSYTTVPGYVVQGNLGYDIANSPLGVRLTAALARPDEQAYSASLGGRPGVGNLTADLKLRLPIFSGNQFPMFGLYAVGGGAYVIFRDLPQMGTNGSISVSQPGKLDSEMGWNLGGGASLQLGHSRELFLEARMISFHMDAYTRSGQMPIVLGMNWY